MDAKERRAAPFGDVIDFTKMAFFLSEAMPEAAENTIVASLINLYQ